ncbi:uncharacterized protein EI90DRAFT_3127739 [Cantharellus anzutake]|uniref:uncharacterized protein n=1 Tax=Cantharellus anzutake TaxID=1750568 RepID=UPI0019079095|nr:uncharacterized protein EI90DRAFT_3127739 [Cantharellus anzutake]KAF8326528.1 hypothetical protein EI90DRAFT_3127739 [Cantharellus anzutake]
MSSPSSEAPKSAVSTSDAHSVSTSASVLRPSTTSGFPVAPYQPYDPIAEESEKKEEEPQSPDQAEHSHVVVGATGIFSRGYMTISYLLGFKERWSLTLFIVFGGALIGFVLARSFMLDPRASNQKRHLPPGEWFWAGRPPIRGALIAHVYSSFFLAWGTIFEFLPVLRRRTLVLHSINGYIILAILPASIGSGFVIARRTIGGAPDTQVLFYLLGLLVLISATLGMVWVRDVRQHRKWMLRFASLLGVVITARIIMLAARRIISDIGTYYADILDLQLFSCAEILALAPSTLSQYPSCTVAQQSGQFLGSVFVGVHASVNEEPINYGAAFRLAMAAGLWIAFILHVCGIELYIHLSEKANLHLKGYELTR